MRQAAVCLVLILAAGLAQAQENPKRKSGLWEITRTTTRNQNTRQLMQWCIDQSKDNALNQLAEGVVNETCTIDKTQRDGDRLVVDAVCKLGPEHAVGKTHAVITGSFDSAYHLESNSSYDPPMRGGKTEGTAVFDAKWAGAACRPGQNPGEVILPSGVKVGQSWEAIKAEQAAKAKESPPTPAKKRNIGTPSDNSATPPATK
jgi:hypothetical protein